jgi:hypothetical protein
MAFTGFAATTASTAAAEGPNRALLLTVVGTIGSSAQVLPVHEMSVLVSHIWRFSF